jgi:unsaturated chondroitin disaccharide hydrolase
MNFEQGWEQTIIKVSRMMDQIGERSPHAAKEGIYDDMGLDWWTSGFWPGMLWILYDMTGEERFRNKAWNWDKRLEQEMIKDTNFDHDVGFQFLPTAVIKYKITGDIDARRRALQAANFLAGRFNLAGNFLRAWNHEKSGWAIVDSCMNLSLLFWAAEEGKDPRFKHIAIAHADIVLKHFIREDGSVNHIVSFDPNTGDFIESIGGQGHQFNSAWSRGHAWALYGIANTYRATGEARFLNAAKRVAHFFLASLPEDHVPVWDFRVNDATVEPKDTSAASCAASGLLEIAKLVPLNEARLYQIAAERILYGLDTNLKSSFSLFLSLNELCLLV